MSKRAEQNKISSTTNGVSLEQNTIYDDSLLPAAEELSKLNELNSEIIPWVMKRTEIEQNARINFNKKRTALAFREINYSAFLSLFGLALCAIVFIGIFYLSYLLITGGNAAAGTLFGCLDIASIMMAVNKFNLRKKK
ncbi:MAG: hypothetical protein E7082_07385 [Bacteroidales bacterium]|nr:hypothetical protein [Bacteroidales bacterium]